MKATDVIQPAVLSAPIAVNGSKDTIPQEQASALYPWYCSVENGFPDVTMQPLNSGGKPPRGQGMNGLLNVISDQKVYLQNGGVITFDSNVSNAIGGYPQGAILDYVSGSTVTKVLSLIDDNTYNFVTTPAYIDGDHWVQLDTAPDKADVDLSNVNSTGMAFGATWAMPSSRRNNLTIGASGSTYKAPATGWFYLLGAVSSYNDWAALISYSKHYAVGNGGGTYQLIIPAVRGDVITLEYTSGANLQTFRFIYAQGEV